MKSCTNSLTDPSNTYETMDTSSNWHSTQTNGSSLLGYIRNQIERLCIAIIKPGVFSGNQLSGAGFQYTGKGDAARCKDCALEVCNWTLDMSPFGIHSKKSPNCPFVCSIKISPPLQTVQSTSTSDEQESAQIKFQIIDPEYL